MITQIVTRDGLPPIKFTGEEIGMGTTKNHSSTRWSIVVIYATKAGKFVVAIETITQWQGETDSFSASSFATAREVIDWLGRDTGEGDGKLDRASQDAVERAAKNSEAFALAWCETVD